jgi:hypothetical protein
VRVVRAAKPRKWSPSVNPASIPDGVLASECARRIALMPEGPRKEARRALLREFLVSMVPGAAVME